MTTFPYSKGLGNQAYFWAFGMLKQSVDKAQPLSIARWDAASQNARLITGTIAGVTNLTNRSTPERAYAHGECPQSISYISRLDLGIAIMILEDQWRTKSSSPTVHFAGMVEVQSAQIGHDTPESSSPVLTKTYCRIYLQQRGLWCAASEVKLGGEGREVGWS